MSMQQSTASSAIPAPVVSATLAQLTSSTAAVELSLHRLVNQAMDAPEALRKRAWLIVLRGMLLAHRNDDLSKPALEHFLRECPSEFKDIHFRFLNEAGMLEKPSNRNSSPLGNKTPAAAERAKRAAVLAARRAERNADRPIGRHESATDPHGKGKKNGKKK